MPEPITDPHDQGAEDHPQPTQQACSARHHEHGLTWRCVLPILHGGPHASGPVRWTR